MGYEDINDHETLRHDAIFALAVGKVVNEEQQPITVLSLPLCKKVKYY
jgi:hypothetical protein